MNRFPFVALLAFSVSAFSFPLAAEDTAKGGGTSRSVFISVDGGARLFNTPRFKGTYSDSSGKNQPLDHDPFMVLSGGEGEVGLAFTKGGGGWLGKKPRVSLFGGAFTGEAGKGAETVNLSTGGFVAINGTGAGTQGAFPYETDMDVSMDLYEIGLRASTDFDLGDRVRLSPELALFGGREKTSIEARQRNVNAIHNFDVDLKSRSLGSTLGATASYRVTDMVDLSLKGTVGFNHVSTKLDAKDCAGNGATSLGTPCNGATWRTSATDSDSAVGMVAGGLLGLTVNPDGRWSVSIDGGARYDQAVPTYVNATNVSRRPMHIDYVDRVSYLANLRISVNF